MQAFRASPFASAPKASSSWFFCRLADHETSRPTHHFQRSGLRPTEIGLLCPLLTSAPRSPASRRAQSRLRDTAQISRGKLDRLPRSPADLLSQALDSRGLRGHPPARPAWAASYPVLVHRVAALLPRPLPFRRRLATTPLRFAIPSSLSDWEEDFHLQAVEHARHTSWMRRLLTDHGLVRPHRYRQPSRSVLANLVYNMCRLLWLERHAAPAWKPPGNRRAANSLKPHPGAHRSLPAPSTGLQVTVFPQPWR